MLKVYFDEYELNRYCEIIKVLPNVASSDGHLEVEVDIAMVEDVMQNLDELNKILFTKEPKKLVISDYPDRYLSCQLSGGIKMSSRFFMAQTTLKFVSEDKYWRSTKGELAVESDMTGTFEVVNNGTAPAVPKFKVTFPSECGFLAITAPNGYIALGDKGEKDRIYLPRQIVALDEKLDQNSINSFEKVSNDSLIPDYKKLSLNTGVTGYSSTGLSLKKSESPKDGYYWNSVGFQKKFRESAYGDVEGESFKLRANLMLYDASGTTAHTGMYLIVVMTDDNKPIMSTSVYNVEGNTNEVIVTAKINTLTGDRKSSKIIKTAKFISGYNGNIVMQKEGSTFSWVFNSGKKQEETITVGQDEGFYIGNTVYIKNSARYGYHDNGTRYSIADFTRGRPNVIKEKRTFQGKTQFMISFQNTRIYWMNEEDLTKDRSGVGQTKQTRTQQGESVVRHYTWNNELATLKPDKLVVVAGVWDNTAPFTHALLSDVTVQKIYGDNKFKEITNVFNAGDVLTIDNSTSDILLNGSTFTGLVDYDSRFFDIDFGKNELQMTVSDWAKMPKGKLYFEERYR